MSVQSLRFTKFRVWQVVVPARTEIISASATKGNIYRDSGRWPEMPIFLVEGETSGGFTAVGEANRGTSRASVEATLNDLLARDLTTINPATVWLEPFAPNGLPMSYPFYSWQTAGERAYFLLESLWYDALGKASGLPAHRLMGGAVRDIVPADFWVYRPDAKTMAALVKEAVELGLQGMKMKCDSTGDTVRSVLTIASDVPETFRFTIDPMYAWRSLRESARYFEELAALPNPIQIEDPFPYTVEDDWRRARDYSPLTVVCHPRRSDIFRHALREDLADAYNLGGGSTIEFQRMATVAEFNSKDCWQGSSIEMGVLQHLRLHASACVPNCLLASDLCSEWVREDTLVTPHMQYRDAGAILPDRPGLGVELDHAAVEKYAQSYFEMEAD